MISRIFTVKVLNLINWGQQVLDPNAFQLLSTCQWVPLNIFLLFFFCCCILPGITLRPISFETFLINFSLIIDEKENTGNPTYQPRRRSFQETSFDVVSSTNSDLFFSWVMICFKDSWIPSEETILMIHKRGEHFCIR